MSIIILLLGFPDGLAGKGSTWKARDLSSKSGLEKSPGEENSYPLQYSGLENSMRLQRVGHAATAAKSLQSCPALCNPVDGSPPGSPISGILQARTLEWVATAFSNISTKKSTIGINLTKYVQDLYKENYKTLINEMKEKLNKWRDSSYSCIGKLNIVSIVTMSVCCRNQ